jgi:NAD-dependent dihydropyrimidine dehydrogenase PreA subunit
VTFVIAEPCIDHIDQSCVAVCPVDCIAGDLAVDRKLYIDPDTCIGCGACASACPNGAIFEASDLPAAWLGYAWVDAAFFRDMNAARAVVEQLAPIRQG